MPLGLYNVYLRAYGKQNKYFLTLSKGKAKKERNTTTLEMAILGRNMLKNTVEIKNKQQALEQSLFLGKLRNAIWLLGISSWLFGITDRSIASFSDGYLSALDLVQLCTASFFFVSWLFLKPTKLENRREEA
jgi:hypothetical protein